MSQYFSEIDSNGIVKRVLVVSQEFINSGQLGDPKNWVETKINGSEKYAGIGDEYHKEIKAFVSPKKYQSWTLDSVKKEYVAPVALPVLKNGETPEWDEINQKWQKVILSTNEIK